MESTEINPCLHGHLIYKRGKIIKWGKDSLCNEWMLRKLDGHMQMEYFTTLFAKIKSKWTEDLNVRPQTLILLEENLGSTVFDIGLRNNF